MTGNPSWSTRLRYTSHIVHVGAWSVAAMATFVSEGVSSAAVVAAVLAAVGVLLSFLVEIPMRSGDVRSIGAIIGGVLVFTAAIAITGGVSSAYVVMPLASIFIAAIAGGFAAAAPTVLLSVGGVIVATAIADTMPSVEGIVLIPAFYVITAIAFSEVQRALLSESERADEIALVTTAAGHRRARLEETHDLLADLLAVATSPDINAVAASQDALRDIAIVLPDTPTRVIGPSDIVLARRGEIPTSDPTDVVAVSRSGRDMGWVELWVDGATISPDQQAVIRESITPIGLALENDDMVQRLAGVTIQRERVRLARELHDDIAPSIASVGLALDMVIVGGELTTDQERTLEATRTNVTGLVDRIRDRVQDLRADRSISIVEHAHSLVAEVDIDGPTVVVDIDERTPPRPAIAVEVRALMTEAFRNALSHADATVIRVSGRVDDRTGRVQIEDNGRGFDADQPVDGHFGLVGMRERASLIGATLDVASDTQDGTKVELTWEEAP